jgi:hypothetical protein
MEAALDRSEKLLALLLLQQMKSAPLAEKASQLSIAGFTSSGVFLAIDTNGALIYSKYNSDVLRLNARNNQLQH